MQRKRGDGVKVYATAKGEKSTNGGPDHNSMRSWYKIERARNSPVVEYVTENSLKFDGGYIDVRHWKFEGTTESSFKTNHRSYFFDLSLGPRPAVRSLLLSLGGGEPTTVLRRIVAIPPNQEVHLQAYKGRYRTMRCIIDASLIDSVLQHEAVWQSNSLRQALQLGGGEIEWILVKMYRELVQRAFGSTTVIESLARALAVEVIRQFNLDENPKAKPKTLGGLAPWKMRLLQERVNADRVPPDLEELAEICCMNVRHLNRAFKEETGQSLGRYVKAVTMERAQKLLAESNLSVKDVADRLGYANPGSFSHAYTTVTGMKPSEVRAQRLDMA